MVGKDSGITILTKDQRYLFESAACLEPPSDCFVSGLECDFMKIVPHCILARFPDLLSFPLYVKKLEKLLEDNCFTFSLNSSRFKIAYDKTE